MCKNRKEMQCKHHYFNNKSIKAFVTVTVENFST